MNIVVFIKQVPDVPAIKIDHQRMTIIREGVDSIINPLDYVALLCAKELKQREGGHMTVVTMGPPQSEEALRESLAAGADRAILLTDSYFAGADTLATSHVLASAVRRMEQFPDLILCGMQTVDSDTGHVGPQIAEELDLPQVCGVTEILSEGEHLLVKRLGDGFLDTVKVSIPALLTINSGFQETEHLSLGEVDKAFSEKQIVCWSRQDLGLSRDDVGFKGSATQVWRLQKPPASKKAEIITGSPQILTDAFVKKLEELSLVDEEDTGE